MPVQSETSGATHLISATRSAVTALTHLIPLRLARGLFTPFRQAMSLSPVTYLTSRCLSTLDFIFLLHLYSTSSAIDFSQGTTPLTMVCVPLPPSSRHPAHMLTRLVPHSPGPPPPFTRAGHAPLRPARRGAGGSGRRGLDEHGRMGPGAGYVSSTYSHPRVLAVPGTRGSGHELIVPSGNAL